MNRKREKKRILLVGDNGSKNHFLSQINGNGFFNLSVDYSGCVICLSDYPGLVPDAIIYTNSNATRKDYPCIAIDYEAHKMDAKTCLVQLLHGMEKHFYKGVNTFLLIQHSNMLMPELLDLLLLNFVCVFNSETVDLPDLSEGVVSNSLK